MLDQRADECLHALIGHESDLNPPRALQARPEESAPSFQCRRGSAGPHATGYTRLLDSRRARSAAWRLLPADVRLRAGIRRCAPPRGPTRAAPRVSRRVVVA